MNAAHLDRIKQRHAWGAWLALWLLLWQTVASAGLIQTPMPPIASADTGFTICSEDGMRTLPHDGVPGHPPSHDGAPSCPCCLPFSPGAGAAILASAILLPIPAWFAARSFLVPAAAPRSRDAASIPQQPRAPPVLV